MAQKIGNLLDKFGGAENLFKCNPEKLGKVLLDYLLHDVDDKRKIDLDSVISHSHLFERFDAGDRYTKDQVREMRCRYPKGKDEDVLYTLMEGWQWLILEGLVAQVPKMRPTLGTQLYFVTRLGIKMNSLIKEL